MSKKHTLHRLYSLKKHHLILILVIIISFVLEIIFYNKYIVAKQTKPVIDSRKTEMKQVPANIKKGLETASSSLVLRVPIIMYHYVEYVRDKGDTIRISLNVLPSVFENQVKTLQSAGYTFLTAAELGNVLDGKKQLPEKPVVLTFDDGYRDFYTDAFPILKKYHVKATAYLISGFIGKPNYMFASQVDEVVKSGLIDIGAHTVHHVALKGKLAKVVLSEVEGSKTELERQFHIPVVSFAYPNGSFDEQAISVVKNAGFSTAVSTIPGIEQNRANRFLLYRIRPGYKVGKTLLDYLAQDKFRVW